jgi:hypothetical protein
MKLSTLTLLLFLGVTLPLGAASTVPTLLSYQGSVTDSAGVAIGNTAAVNRTVLFKLYSSSAGGTPIWAESQVVTISGGAFSVLIGNGTGISGLTGPSSPASPVRSVVDIINSTANEGVYLGVSVSDGTAAAPAEISPRQRLVSAAYAARATVAETVAAGGITTAAIADGQITAQKLGSGIVDHSKIATSAVQSNSILDGTIVAADIAAGAITSDKLSGSIGLWQTDSTGINYTNGNVSTGRGNSVLQVNGALHAQGAINSHGQGAYLEWNKENGTGRTYLLNQKAGGSGGIVFGEADTGNGWSENVFFSHDAKVGIGMTSPGFPLNFANVLGDKIALWGNTGNHYGLGIRTGQLQIHTEKVDNDITFGYGSSASDTSMTETMRIKGNGNVGIGTNSPTNKLTIGNGGWINFAAADGVSSGIKGTMAGSDVWEIYGSGSNNNGALIIKTGDDSNEPIQFHQSGSYRGGIASDGNWETGENMSIRINGNYNGEQADAYLSMGTSGYFSINTYNTRQNVRNWRTAIYDGDSNWDYSSDVRFKQDIVDAEPMLDSLMQVRFRRFHWKGGDASDPLMFGVIAQELEPIFPSLVTDRLLPGDTTESKTVAYTEFATIAAKSVQELKVRHDAELDDLKIRTGDLENRLSEKDAVIAALEARLAALEARLAPSN